MSESKNGSSRPTRSPHPEKASASKRAGKRWRNESSRAVGRGGRAAGSSRSRGVISRGLRQDRIMGRRAGSRHRPGGGRVRHSAAPRGSAGRAPRPLQVSGRERSPDPARLAASWPRGRASAGGSGIRVRRSRRVSGRRAPERRGLRAPVPHRARRGLHGGEGVPTRSAGPAPLRRVQISRRGHASSRTASVPSNSQVLWLPSQNGFLLECPHRHRE